MKIGIISSHAYPVPWVTHAGDYFYADLAKTFDEMGHDVTFFAPDGSYVPPHGKQLSMPCAYGAFPPTAESCEQACFDKHKDILIQQDIVHDFSSSKTIAANLNNIDFKRTIVSPLGSNWHQIKSKKNIVVTSQNMKDRAMVGGSDYKDTPFQHYENTTYSPISDAHVVHCGIDTEFYKPKYNKGNFYLWLSRWHPVRGYKLAIEIAKKAKIELVMSGTHPDDEIFEAQKNCALEAMELAKGYSNISFSFLRADPNHHTTKLDLYQKAKAFLFTPQFQEPFGLTQAEVLSCGTPILGTNFGSVPEIIEHGKTGFVCENNVESFSEAIDRTNDIKLEDCREEAVRRFDRHVMALNYMKEYRMVIEGKTW